MDPIEANRMYYREHADRYDADEQPFVHQRVYVERLLSQLSVSADDPAVLDFGAGTGAATQVLASTFAGARVCGVDVSAEMLAIAARKCPEATLQVYDGHRLPFEAGMFDGVLISSVLHHVRDYESVLREVARMCRPSAWVLITQEPNPWVARWANRVRRFTNRDLPEVVKRAEHYQFSKEGGIPPRRIMDLLQAEGFACELLYNNEVLLDRFLISRPWLYHVTKPICQLGLMPCRLSYNVVARRKS